MNQINKDLRDCRLAIEHYKRILQEDTWISIGEMVDDGRPKLSHSDRNRINKKLEILEEKRQELLKQEKDYQEVIN